VTAAEPARYGHRLEMRDHEAKSSVLQSSVAANSRSETEAASTFHSRIRGDARESSKASSFFTTQPPAAWRAASIELV
jgi:hypothetical protein